MIDTRTIEVMMSRRAMARGYRRGAAEETLKCESGRVHLPTSDKRGGAWN